MILAEVLPNNQLIIEGGIVSDSVKYESIKFIFHDKWIAYEKTVVFKFGEGNAINVVLNSANSLCLSENECYIPFEVLNSPEFTVSVFGIKDESRITTTRATVIVLESGYELGDEPTEPTADEYAQIIDIMNSTQSAVESIRNGAVDKLLGDNVFVFGGGNAYDENIWPPTTDEVHNPETNLVQSKRPITSKGVYAAFKAFYERIIQAINDKFSLHKDYIVEEGTTDGGWSYIKLKNGFAECWAEVSGTTTAGTTPTVGINTMTVHFPLYFLEGKFNISVTPARNATQVSWYGECNGAGNPQRGSGYCYLSYKLSSEHIPTFHVRVVGKYSV